MSEGLAVGFIVTLAIGVVVGGCYAYPQYNVYNQRMEGEAQYAKAESERQIRVLEAKAALESAEMTAAAEVARAKGVAEANTVIANGLGGPEGYLRWRYIEMLENTATGGRDVIYVPTEANIPIMEAGRIGLR